MEIVDVSTLSHRRSERCHCFGEAGVDILLPATSLTDDGRGCVFTLIDGSMHHFKTVYPVLGSDAQSQLAAALGAAIDDNGELIVDAHLQTAVDGLYAVGDVVSTLNQISVAVGHAAIAATAIHRRLPHIFRDEAASQPEMAADVPRRSASVLWRLKRGVTAHWSRS